MLLESASGRKMLDQEDIGQIADFLCISPAEVSQILPPAGDRRYVLRDFVGPGHQTLKELGIKFVKKIGSGGMGDVDLGVQSPDYFVHTHRDAGTTRLNAPDDLATLTAEFESKKEDFYKLYEFSPADVRTAVKTSNNKASNDEALLMRFIREGHILGTRMHKQIPYAFHPGDKVGDKDGDKVIAMSFSDGHELSQMENLNIGNYLRIMRSAVAPLATAYYKFDVIHRDLKPQNIIVGRWRNGEYRADVIDFGIAKKKDLDLPDLHSINLQQTIGDMRAGTPVFMSPEHAKRLADVEVRSDIYCLFAMLYNLMTKTKKYPFGKLPVIIGKDESDNDIIQKIRTGRDLRTDPRKFNPAVPVRVAELIEHGLQHNIDERIQTYDEVEERLDEVIGEDEKVNKTVIGEPSPEPSVINIQPLPGIHEFIVDAGRYLVDGKPELVSTLDIPEEVRNDDRYKNLVRSLELLADDANYVPTLEGLEEDVEEWNEERDDYLERVAAYDSEGRPPRHQNLSGVFFDTILGTLVKKYGTLPSLKIKSRLDDEEADVEKRTKSDLIFHIFKDAAGHDNMEVLDEKYKEMAFHYKSLLDTVAGKMRNTPADLRGIFIDSFRSRAMAYVYLQQHIIEALKAHRVPAGEVISQIVQGFRDLGQNTVADKMEKRYDSKV